MEHDLNILMIFGTKQKMYNFDPYNVLLSISTNIAVLLMTAFVLQRRILQCFFAEFLLFCLFIVLPNVRDHFFKYNF